MIVSRNFEVIYIHLTKRNTVSLFLVNLCRGEKGLTERVMGVRVYKRVSRTVQSTT